MSAKAAHLLVGRPIEGNTEHPSWPHHQAGMKPSWINLLATFLFRSFLETGGRRVQERAPGGGRGVTMYVFRKGWICAPSTHRILLVDILLAQSAFLTSWRYERLFSRFQFFLPSHTRAARNGAESSSNRLYPSARLSLKATASKLQSHLRVFWALNHTASFSSC